MKTKFSRRILAFVLVLALAVPMFVFNVTAADESASISFANKAQRTVFTTSQQVWEQNGIILTNDKGASTSNVADYSNPARFYKSSKITVKCTLGNITKIEFTANSSSYANALKSSITSGTATVSGSVVTVIPASESDTYVINSLTGGQVRLNSMKVYYESVGGEPVPSIALSADKTSVLVGNTINLTAKTENTTGEVTWSSDNEDVATVVNGVVTTHSFGSATITATVDEISARITVGAYPEGGEYSIADMIEICKGVGESNSTNTYTTTGVIKSIDTPYDSGYNNVTVTITANNSSIKVFRLTGGKDLKVGDTIKVTGKVVNYMGNTPEFVQGCTFVKVTTINDITSSMALAYKYEHEDGIYSNSNFAFKFTIDATVADIADITAYGIKVSAGGKDVYYNEEESISWTEENGKIYVIVELGDIINDTAKLETVFTVTAYVEADGDILTSKNSTSYSVASIVAHYVDTLGIEEITHLYDFISNEHGLI